MENNKLWFKSKLYGWGWTPTSWQGWLVTTAWIIINIKYFSIIEKNSHSGSNVLISFSPVFIISTVLLLIICYKKGEKPRWRWGNK